MMAMMMDNNTHSQQRETIFNNNMKNEEEEKKGARYVCVDGFCGAIAIINSGGIDWLDINSELASYSTHHSLIGHD
jgi:hypothetical protein